VEKIVAHSSLVNGDIILMTVLCVVSISRMYTDTLKIFQDITTIIHKYNQLADFMDLCLSSKANRSATS
jgi:hypothetical protein